ncbi:MAG: type II toxin-antitoxin system RelE/ParE family toxin [Cytophagaceae bacterium]|nr:type II toxin-antitoxin system RelE/ParE family toxin [Cytophagaceae bacterium]MBK9932922.1 type II toxin-antitoxin system RelE/ParE family toxin [Cytophagaceae bacterium]MBL0303369.1 type II toxin-antitoxin system RelE/ParE family toxin [Cytophagaceae bacterium]MBL0326217.1 type II toxin-antitoxin system RelE/ParE family toxin [Cytophagaceae bacterium]
MAPRKIVWTQKAQFERKEILEYWIIRNKSATYSIKLNKKIIETLRMLSFNPFLGRKSEIESIRIKLVKDYFLIYQITSEEIVVLSLWDSRRNPEMLKIF